MNNHAENKRVNNERFDSLVRESLTSGQITIVQSNELEGNGHEWIDGIAWRAEHVTACDEWSEFRGPGWCVRVEMSAEHRPREETIEATQQAINGVTGEDVLWTEFTSIADENALSARIRTDSAVIAIACRETELPMTHCAFPFLCSSVHGISDVSLARNLQIHRAIQVAKQHPECKTVVLMDDDIVIDHDALCTLIVDSRTSDSIVSGVYCPRGQPKELVVHYHEDGENSFVSVGLGLLAIPLRILREYEQKVMLRSFDWDGESVGGYTMSMVVGRQWMSEDIVLCAALAELGHRVAINPAVIGAHLDGYGLPWLPDESALPVKVTRPSTDDGSEPTQPEPIADS